MKARTAADPTVSVVVPTYRRPHMIDEVIACVMQQTFTDWELLIIDDNGEGSAAQTETAAVVDRYRSDARVMYVTHERNRGACAARNTGLQRAAGTFVAFLDDDDVWHPEKLERQVACFASAEPDVALVYGGWRNLFDDGTVDRIMPDGSEKSAPDLLKRNGIGSTSLVMCRRSALLAVGGFDETLPAMQDFDLYIRLGLRFPFAYVDRVLMDYRTHGGQRITTHPQAVQTANERFLAKHRHLFEADPDVHQYRLRSYALDMLRAGQFAKARSLYRAAWRVRRRHVQALVLGVVVCEPLVASYRRLKRWFRPSSRQGRSLPLGRAQDRRAS